MLCILHQGSESVGLTLASWIQSVVTPVSPVFLKNFTWQLEKLMSTWPWYRPRRWGNPWQMVQFGIIWNSTIIEIKLCYREGRTGKSRNKASSRVWEWRGCLKIITITWRKYFPPMEADSRQHVDSKVKLFHDTEGHVSERSPAFQMGRRCPATLFERSICLLVFSERKSASIFKMGSIVFMSRENVIYNTK